MLLDPFTIVAQILNFAVLVIALKYLLYDRVIRAMDKREAGIAARLAEADRRRAEADERAERLEEQQRELDRRRESVLEQARHEAQAHRHELLEQARDDVDEQRELWHQSLDRERADLAEELQRRTAVVVVDLTRSALADLADEDLERVVIERALRQLSDDPSARSALMNPQAGAQSGADAQPEVVVRSALPLADQADAVRARLHELGLDEQVRVRFERDDRLIVGVEISAAGTAVDWNAHDYLTRLEAAIDDLLDEVLGEQGGDDAP
jgi:F-type H+-transporting ATPase subunit b